MHDKPIELNDDERTRCGVWVSEDRSSGGRTQPSERPAGKPGRTAAPGTVRGIELADRERTRCEVWTRVMGYHRPVSAWNPGKCAEHAERRYFIEPAARSGPGAAGRGPE
jgi:hypothetical protein